MVPAFYFRLGYKAISHQQIRLGIDKQALCSGIRLKLRLSLKYRIIVVPDLI